MKVLPFLLLMLLPLVSCTVATRATILPDGTQDKQLYAQLGGKGGYVGGADGGMVAQADNEKSFGQAMTAAGVMAATAAWSAVERAATNANAATAQTATRSAAATEQARIKATERAATSLGNNPEANTGAVKAVSTLFR
jgi:hypothetical protein